MSEHRLSPAELNSSEDQRAKLVARGMVVMDDAALNAEAPAHLLDDPITPAERFFVRNNGLLPAVDLSAENWRLTVDGEVERPLVLSLDDLRARFETVEVTAVMECAGNGRAFFAERFEGVRWRLGAVGCAVWSGVRLADILDAAGTKPAAAYLGHLSPDKAVDGPGEALSRGLPLWKARAPETIVAFAMNGAPLGPLHGAPLRIVAPGFPGSAWQKWLSRIWVRDREHDGAKMTGLDYRMPTRRLASGEAPAPGEMAVIEDMPVKSLITFPAENARVAAAAATEIRGHAWSGQVPVDRVEISLDGGGTFQPARLEPAPDRFAWARFRLAWTPPAPGRATLVARAWDAQGNAQPLDSAPWNPRGYCNNRCHRVEVEIA